MNEFIRLGKENDIKISLAEDRVLFLKALLSF